MLDAEPVDIFGSDTPAPVEEEKPNEEDENNKGDEDDENDDEGDDEDGEDGDEDDDFDPNEIDLDKETDPEKLRKAAKHHATSSKNKSLSIKDLRKARRRTAAANNSDDVGDFEPPYSKDETTYVKDLPKDKQDAMTDTEKRLWDDGVKTKELLNKDAKEKFDAKVEAAKKAAENVDDSIVLDDEVEDFVKDGALELADGDKKKANEIIKYFNKYNKNTSGLTEDEIIDRLNDAYKLTGSYQPPRDQKTGKKGKAAKKNGKDPHGVDSIVESLGSTDTKQPIAL